MKIMVDIETTKSIFITLKKKINTYEFEIKRHHGSERIR
jgi:hypothetical protein